MAATAQKTEETPTEVRKVKAIVARGRSVEVSVGRKIVGQAGDGKDREAVYGPVTKVFTAGQEVELPVDEVARLRKIGYLVDPEIPPPPLAEGPNFEERGYSGRA